MVKGNANQGTPLLGTCVGSLTELVLTLAYTLEALGHSKNHRGLDTNTRNSDLTGLGCSLGFRVLKAPQLISGHREGRASLTTTEDKDQTSQQALRPDLPLSLKYLTPQPRQTAQCSSLQPCSSKMPLPSLFLFPGILVHTGKTLTHIQDPMQK